MLLEVLTVAWVLWTGLITRACYRMVFYPKLDPARRENIEELLALVDRLSKQNSELAECVTSLRSEVQELRRLVLREEH